MRSNDEIKYEKNEIQKNTIQFSNVLRNASRQNYSNNIVITVRFYFWNLFLENNVYNRHEKLQLLHSPI